MRDSALRVRRDRKQLWTHPALGPYLTPFTSVTCTTVEPVGGRLECGLVDFSRKNSFTILCSYNMFLYEAPLFIPKSYKQANKQNHMHRLVDAYTELCTLSLTLFFLSLSLTPLYLSLSLCALWFVVYEIKV